MMQPSDRLVASPRGSADEALAYFKNIDVKRRDMVTQFINAAYAFASPIDPSIVIAQASHETDKFRSYWWNERLNPAGLGITDDPAQHPYSPTFVSGIQAARAQTAHLLMYATGSTAPFETTDDPRYDVYVNKHGDVGVASTIADLANTWATDPIYAQGICKHGNAIFGEQEEEQPQQPSLPTESVSTSVLKSQGKPWTGEKHVRVNGRLYRALRVEVTTTLDKMNLRVYANTNSEIVRTVPKGTTLNTLGWVVGEKVGSENRWWVLDDYSRMWAGGTGRKP